MRSIIAVCIGLGLVLFSYWAIPEMIHWAKGGDSGVWDVLRGVLVMVPIIMLVILAYALPLGATLDGDVLSFNLVCWFNLGLCALLALYALNGHWWKLHLLVVLALAIRGILVLRGGSDKAHAYKSDKWRGGTH